MVLKSFLLVTTEKALFKPIALFTHRGRAPIDSVMLTDDRSSQSSSGYGMVARGTTQL